MSDPKLATPWDQYQADIGASDSEDELDMLVKDYVARYPDERERAIAAMEARERQLKRAFPVKRMKRAAFGLVVGLAIAWAWKGCDAVTDAHWMTLFEVELVGALLGAFGGFVTTRR